ITAAKIGLNGRHEPVEDLRRARPAVELVPGEQLRPARSMPAATRGFLGAFRGASRRQVGGIWVFFHGAFATSIVVSLPYAVFGTFWAPRAVPAVGLSA